MGDVAQILGVTKAGSGSASSAVNRRQNAALPASHQPTRAQQLQGMPRQVLDILGGGSASKQRKTDLNTVELPPIVPGNNLVDNSSSSNAANLIKVGGKSINKNKIVRPWVWAPFASSSRTDGALFCHWVRANVDYPDYPYARFDIHLDPVAVYTDEEYMRYNLHTNSIGGSNNSSTGGANSNNNNNNNNNSGFWTKCETDTLMEYARKYELRWPVIYDRWIGDFYTDNNLPVPENRQIEDLQYRYYQVAAVLNQSRISQQAALEVQALTNSSSSNSNVDTANTSMLGEDGGNNTDDVASNDTLLLETAAARSLASADPQHQPFMANIGTGSTNKPVFDLQHERQRRAYWQAVWNRSKEEEEEEAALRLELKQVETQLRKLKKQGGHILAAASGANRNVASSSRNTSRSVSPIPGISVNAATTASTPPTDPVVMVDRAMASIVPIPTPGFPYLQSGRLAQPSVGGPNGLNKALLNRLETVLNELKVPVKPMATKRVCDVYDTVRQDALKLLVLQKNLLQKEGLVESKRLKLAKMGGNVRVVQEETLMGIAPAPVSTAATAASVSSTAATATGRPKTQKPKSKIQGKKPIKTGDKTEKTTKTATGTVTASGIAGATTSSTPTKDTGSKTTKKAVVKRKRKIEPSDTVTSSAGGAVTAASATNVQSGDKISVAQAELSAPKTATTAKSLPDASGESKASGKKRQKKT